MNLSRDAWIAIGLIFFLFVVTGFAAVQQAQVPNLPALYSDSAAPDGAKALRLWLSELGYQVLTDPVPSFLPPEDTDVTLILAPLIPLTDEDWQILDPWVDAGGTVIIVGDDRFRMAPVFRHYRFDLASTNRTTSTVTMQTPLWQTPALNSDISMDFSAYLQTRRDDYVTHLAVDEKPLVVSFDQEAGHVVLSAVPFSFSNAGLKKSGNAAFVLNMIQAAGTRDGETATTIWFDEWHHGFRADQAEVIGPFNWLRYTPTGRSILYATAVIFVGLVLRGRHFGRPLPLRKTLVRRAPLEYITAIANLSRRAGHRQSIMTHYHFQLKRELGRRYRLNPTLSDEEYIRELGHLNSTYDTAALRV
ncbi:MAG: DUF4350 domain-containing protein, partial [Chloroflexota bacterium]